MLIIGFANNFLKKTYVVLLISSRTRPPEKSINGTVILTTETPL